MEFTPEVTATPTEKDRPSRPLYEGEWKLSPELRAREERRARQSWGSSFRGGANEAAMLRNISAERPDWSPEMVAKFYETQVLPEITRAIDETPIASFTEAGIPNPRKYGGGVHFPEDKRIAIDRSGRQREWPVVTHEVGHAVDAAVERAFGQHRSKEGAYGDIGADLLARNERARKKAFPFSETYEEASPRWMRPQGRSLFGHLMWDRVPHAEQAPEVQNVMRELRRHLGRDPTGAELREIVEDPNPWGASREGKSVDMGYGGAVGAREGTKDYAPRGMLPHDIQRHFREDKPTWDTNPKDVRLRSGAPSYEDIAKAVEEFSYALPTQQPKTLYSAQSEGLVSPEMMSKMFAAS